MQSFRLVLSLITCGALTKTSGLATGRRVLSRCKSALEELTGKVAMSWELMVLDHALAAYRGWAEYSLTDCG